MNESAAIPQSTTAPSSLNLNRSLWEKGDFTQIAETMRESGAELLIVGDCYSVEERQFI